MANTKTYGSGVIEGQDEGTKVLDFSVIDFVGAGIALTNVGGVATVTAAGGGGLSNVVEDLTPQAGGAFDMNAFDLQFDDNTGIDDDSGNELIVFQSTVLAVNQIDVTNAATGNAPKIDATGGDTNIDLELLGKGTGVVKANGFQTNLVEIGVAVSDETTDLTTGTAKVTFRMPYAMTLTSVRANVNTAPVGSTIIVDINESASTILSTKLTIDASEKTSQTAATAPVISDSALADDAEITIDIDQIGSSTAGKGLKIWLIGTRV